MKWSSGPGRAPSCILLLASVLALVLLVLLAARARADEPWTYAATQCTGLSHAEVIAAVQNYTTQYGYAHQLTTLDAWRAAHSAIVNGWLSEHGCPAALIEQPDGSSKLSKVFQWYVPIYMRDRGVFP